MIADGKICEAKADGSINTDHNNCGRDERSFDWSRPVRVRVPALTTEMLLSTEIPDEEGNMKPVGEVIGANPFLRPEEAFREGDHTTPTLDKEFNAAGANCTEWKLDISIPSQHVNGWVIRPRCPLYHCADRR